MKKDGKVVSFINMKGGVGKTTLCIGIGEYLAHYLNKRVLFIDLDPQFNTTQSLMNFFELEDEYMTNYSVKNKTVRRLFESPTTVSEMPKLPEKEDVIIDLDYNISIIAGTINLIFDDNNKSTSASRRVKKFIEENALRNEYDYIFIDCPPTISLYTDSALIASDYYLVPVKVDRYSILGIKLLDQVIERLKFDETLNIKPLGIVYTMLDNTITQKTKKIMETLESSEIVNKIGLFETKTFFVRDLMVGLGGNIASRYNSSRIDIEALCSEFMKEVEKNE